MDMLYSVSLNLPFDSTMSSCDILQSYYEEVASCQKHIYAEYWIIDKLRSSLDKVQSQSVEPGSLWKLVEQLSNIVDRVY